MVKLYYPPAALLVQGTKDFVELGGAQCILAMDEEKQFIVISDVFWSSLGKILEGSGHFRSNRKDHYAT